MSTSETTTPFAWVRRGRCYRLGHDVPHMGGVVPMRVVSEMRFDPKDIVPHLFAETDPGFHERCRPGDVIVEVAQGEVTTPAQAQERIRAQRDAGRASVLMMIERGGAQRAVALPVAPG